MATFMFLVTPLPRQIRKKVLTSLQDIPGIEKAALFLRFTFVFILILFIDSVNRVYRVAAEMEQSQLGIRSVGNMISVERSEIQARKFYSQRNMYLCGFTLFLSLILNRTHSLVLDLINAQDTVDLLKSGSDAKVKAEALSSESKAEIARLKEELEAKDRDLQTLKKQSEALSKEYANISDELNAKGGAKPTDKKND
jgi:B-cell receptor-associated protein 31